MIALLDDDLGPTAGAAFRLGSPRRTPPGGRQRPAIWTDASTVWARLLAGTG